MPGLPHQRAAAVAKDVRGQVSGALHVVNDAGARIALEHVGGEQHQQAVRIDDLARLRHHTQAIAVAIEGQADVGVGPLHDADQVLQVGRVARIGMVVREGAVHFAVKRLDVGADGGKQVGRDAAGHAAAAVDDDLELAFDLDVAGDAVDVVALEVANAQQAQRIGAEQAVFGNADVDVLDRIAGQGLAVDDDLEAVVVGRIVAARHRHAATGAQMEAAEVSHRRRNFANVDDLAAGLAQAFDQGAGHGGRRQPAVATDHDAALVALVHHRADGLADQPGDILVECLPDHAADVVGAEHASIQSDAGRRRCFGRGAYGLGGFRRDDVARALHLGQGHVHGLGGGRRAVGALRLTAPRPQQGCHCQSTK